jgi:hypothetical protein
LTAQGRARIPNGERKMLSLTELVVVDNKEIVDTGLIMSRTTFARWINQHEYENITANYTPFPAWVIGASRINDVWNIDERLRDVLNEDKKIKVVKIYRTTEAEYEDIRETIELLHSIIEVVIEEQQDGNEDY